MAFPLSLARTPLMPPERLPRLAASSSAVLGLLLTLALCAQPALAAAGNAYDEFSIGTETVDADYVRGAKWTRLEFSPRTSGSHTIRSLSPSAAELQFSVFRIPDSGVGAVRVGTTSGSDSPRRWQGHLDGSKSYYIGVWAAEGSAKFTATVQALDPQTDLKLVRDLSTTPLDSWQIDGTANAVLSSAQTLFVGGQFTSVFNADGARLPRHNLVAIDRSSGLPTDFRARLDGQVFALAISEDQSTLYVGGAFRTAQGLPRKYIAAYDTASGELTRFASPPPNGALRALALEGNKLYFGGLFTSVGSASRSYLAAVDVESGTLDREFVPRPNAKVNAVEVGVERLWVGGEFTGVGGARQRGLAALDPLSGAREPSASLDYPVIDLALSDSRVLIAGGGPGGRAASVSRATAAKQWEIKSDGNFQAVDASDDGFAYFGGHYETIEGNPHVDRLTRHDILTGKTDVSWLPQVNGMRSINALDVTPDGIHFGGDFTKVDGDAHSGFAVIHR